MLGFVFCMFCSFVFGCFLSQCSLVFFFFFFFNDTATTEIYTLHIVGSVRCVQETAYQQQQTNHQHQQQQQYEKPSQQQWSNQQDSQHQKFPTKKNIIQEQQQQKQFLKRILKKFSIVINENIKDFYTLNTFQYKNNMDISSNQMILVTTQNSQLQLFDTSGEWISDVFEIDHNSQLIATSPRSDETQIVSLSTSGEIRIIKLENKRIKVDLGNSSEASSLSLPKYQKKGSKGFNEKWKYQMKLDMKFQIEKTSNFTAFEYVMMKGLKFLIIGDGEGNLMYIPSFQFHIQFIYQYIYYLLFKKSKLNYAHIYIYVYRTYHRNGTFQGIVQVSNQPIKLIYKTLQNLIFATENKIGFFNPISNEVIPPSCDEIYEGILDIQVDQNYNNILYILTKQLNILVFEYSISQQQCTFLLQEQPNLLQQLKTSDQQLSQNQNTQLQKNQHNLITVRNNLLVIDPYSSYVQLFNTTDINGQENNLKDTFLVQIQPKTISNISYFTYKYSRNTYMTSYLLVRESTENTTNIILYEVSTPPSKDIDIFQNLRWPLIIIAVLIVFGWQFYRNKKQNKSGMNHDFSQFENRRQNQAQQPNYKPSVDKYNDETVNKIQQTFEKQTKQLQQLQQLKEKVTSSEQLLQQRQSSQSQGKILQQQKSSAQFRPPQDTYSKLDDIDLDYGKKYN
eukprot:TRINITY_DN27254_c0_g1_i3.p1 TRINITY_DN27254_c0_g1~~TRINITY_DN27254_c0_g1_i3.p1  ORF type:complete len:677 (+),score=116.20 TRINITY_DN27254_c0_g1_i3:32-2062(+)